MEVVVLGSGCSKCHSTMGLVERVAKALGIAVNLTLNESKEDRERLGIHATPAVWLMASSSTVVAFLPTKKWKSGCGPSHWTC